jgi:hypothetical protein
MDMTQTGTAAISPRLHRAITEAISNERSTLGARIGPWVSEAIFWDLRVAGFANDSGYITDTGRAAVAA